MRSRSLLAAGLGLLLATALNASSLATTGKRIAGATSCEVYHLGGDGSGDMTFICFVQRGTTVAPVQRLECKWIDLDITHLAITFCAEPGPIVVGRAVKAQAIASTTLMGPWEIRTHAGEQGRRACLPRTFFLGG